MSLSPSEAADQLKEIEETGRRSAEAFAYASASPQFIVWGLVWMAGYAGTYELLRITNGPGLILWLWLAVVLVGICGGRFISIRQYRAADQTRARAIGLKMGLSILAIYVFIFATMIVMRPVNLVVSGAFIPLIVATIYAIFGIWKGLRFLYAGITVAALTLGGWLYLPTHFLLWMAVVGGGSLILVGLWLRKV